MYYTARECSQCFIITIREIEGLKGLLMRVKEESEKAGLKLSIQKTKIMASRPITSWQIDGEKVEAVTDFIFLGSRITVDNHCSHEIKRCFLLGRIPITNLNNVLKSRDITLLTKACIVKAVIFSSSYVRMWELDHKQGWTPNNWCFWIVNCAEEDSWESLGQEGTDWLNQSILKEINLEYSLEELMLSWSSSTLATWLEEPTEWKRPWCWERLRAGEGGDRGWDGWMASLTQRTWVWGNLGDCERQGRLVCCIPWGRKKSDMT